MLLLFVQGATALHIAAQVGHLQAVRELLAKGAPVAFSISSLCKVQD